MSLCASCQHQILKKVVKENGGKRDGRKQICRNTDREEFTGGICRGITGKEISIPYFASVAKKRKVTSRCQHCFLKTADNGKNMQRCGSKELAGIGDTKENLAAAGRRQEL